MTAGSSDTLSGYLSGAGLIVAIGAQNAFVLRQGLKRRHIGIVVAICATIDVLLIGLGVGGRDALIQRAPVLLDVIRWAGGCRVRVSLWPAGVSRGVARNASKRIRRRC